MDFMFSRDECYTVAFLTMTAPKMRWYFLIKILQSSTQSSLIVTDLRRAILLRNEGARRLYGSNAELRIPGRLRDHDPSHRGTYFSKPLARLGVHLSRKLGGVVGSEITLRSETTDSVNLPVVHAD